MAMRAPKKQKNAAPLLRGKPRLASVVFSTAVVAVGLAVGLTGGSLAKYFQSTDRNTAAKAKEFYFTSNYLTQLGSEYNITPGPGGTVDVSFELSNFEGLNQSELDIHYTVTVTDDTAGTHNVAVSYSGNKTLTAGGNGETETITLNGLQAGKTYTVTATGENGYRQTLTATFVVDSMVTTIFTNTRSYGDYVLLTIWTADKGATVSFTVPTGLIPDATDPALTGKEGIVPGQEATEKNTVTLTLGVNESRSFRFFTTGAYNGSAIAVAGATETTIN